MCTTRPTASVVAMDRLVLDAFRIVASSTWMWPVWQSRSGRLSCASVWYQTTETLPASPAVTQGQRTRAARPRDCDRLRPRLAEVLGVDEHDRVRGRCLVAVAAAARRGLAVVGVPDEVDRSGRVDRDRRPVREHRRAA